MKTIVWDVDDVLNDLMRAWFERAWLPANSSCRMRYEDLANNPPHEILGISLNDYRRSLDAFRRSHLGSLLPVPESLAWFHEHGKRFRHMALTSVPLQTADISAGWVMRHFGRWIRSFNVVPSPRPGDGALDYDHTKRDFLRHAGKVDVFVDDSPKNIREVGELGVATALMPRPWNGGVRTIAECLEYVAILAQ